MTLKELIQRAVDVAGHGFPDLEIAVEPRLPLIFGRISDRYARDPMLRPMLRRTLVLAVTDGSVSLPTNVLTPYLYTSTLVDPTDQTKLYSFAPWNLFIRDYETRIGQYSMKHFDVQSGRGMSELLFLYVTEPGTAYSSSSGPTVTLELTTPCAVLVPASAAGVINARDEVVDDILQELISDIRPEVTKRR